MSPHLTLHVSNGNTSLGTNNTISDHYGQDHSHSGHSHSHDNHSHGDGHGHSHGH